MQFQEYPKKMHHSQHQPAIWKQLEGKGKGLFAPDTVCTQVEKFPEVTVTTVDQEKYYAARGYRPHNMPDPEAYELAMLEAQPTSGYAHQEFPKWQYHALEIPVIVNSAAEEKALGNGWADTPIIATEDDLPVTDAVAVSNAPAAATNAAAEAQAPVVAAVAPKSKHKKVDKRSRQYRNAQKADALA